MDRLRAHYLVERELADRLRMSASHERGRLYGEVYDELFRRVPDHPQLTNGPAVREGDMRWQLRLLGRFLESGMSFLEVGAGDCRLSLAMAPRAQRVVALDVSEEIASAVRRPDNFELVISDGRRVPLPDSSVDLAYSNQLMEHLHPDDVEGQLRELVRVLRPGGRYVCVTPHRYSGPHDISAFFGCEPTGFHLKEYTVGGLRAAFLGAGFTRMDVVINARLRHFVVPAVTATGLERTLDRLPAGVRRKAARSPLRMILGSRVVGVA